MKNSSIAFKIFQSLNDLLKLNEDYRMNLIYTSNYNSFTFIEFVKGEVSYKITREQNPQNKKISYKLVINKGGNVSTHNVFQLKMLIDYLRINNTLSDYLDFDEENYRTYVKKMLKFINDKRKVVRSETTC